MNIGRHALGLNSTNTRCMLIGLHERSVAARGITANEFQEVIYEKSSLITSSSIWYYAWCRIIANAKQLFN